MSADGPGEVPATGGASTRLPNFGELDWKTDAAKNAKKEEKLWVKDWEAQEPDAELLSLVKQTIAEVAAEKNSAPAAPKMSSPEGSD